MKSLRAWLPYLLVFGCLIPFLDKPVHVDDANFLRLAEGAQVDFWRPHEVLINWQGSTQRAFDVLSNPPGIAWILAPVTEKPVWFQHLWMWPWALLALWGMGRLGEVFVGQREAPILILGLSPLFLLSAQGLTPDIPLLACATAGLGGFLSHRKSASLYALLAGCSVFFRYSGVCMIPLVLLAGMLTKRTASAFFSLLPLVALLLHDWHAYGELHLLAMSEFQAVANGPEEVFLKAVALLAMLGGLGLMPFFTWSKQALWSVLVGFLLGTVGCFLVEGSPEMAVAASLFCTAGCLCFSRLGFTTKEDLIVSAWAVGGAAFLLGLRFAAARYWLLFFPALVLAALRVRPSSWRVSVGLITSLLLALGLSLDDKSFALAHQKLADAVAHRGVGEFSGHWGFQHRLEERGWKALDEGSQPKFQGLWARFDQGWPQEPHADACLEKVGRWHVEDNWWGPKGHSRSPAANFHANWISSDPPIQSLIPWTFGNDPYGSVTLFSSCN